MKPIIPAITLIILSNAFAQQAESNSSEMATQAAQMPTDVIKVPRISNSNTNTMNFSDQNIPQKPENTGNAKYERSEFQTFVQYSTGKMLNQYGADFFSNSPSSFASIQNTPVPQDYPLGPGDEILIKAWGGVEIDYKAVIDRNGIITLPTIGSVTLAGVKAGDAESIVKSAISKIYRDFSVAVTFGRLRSITVYVVGQAKKPGSYTVSGLSTVVTALLSSGGPNNIGSMRNVQVKRNGKIVSTLDLYSFIAKGDKSSDIKLQDGDTIYIPTALANIALVGKVNTQAIFELKTSNEPLGSILELAGGLPIVADPRRVFIERIDPSKAQPRVIEDFKLDSTGLGKILKNGDLISINSITPDFSNAVSLRGNVNQQQRVPYFKGMKLRDLIPNTESLITRNVIARRNFEGPDANSGNQGSMSMTNRISDTIEAINWEYAVVERVDKQTQNVSLIPFNLGNMIKDVNSPDNLELQPGDIVTVFSQNDIRVPISKRKVFVKIEGEVSTPGIYEMNQGDSIQSLITKAGGLTNSAYLFGSEFYREQVRIEQQQHLEKAVNRLESQIRAESVKIAANETSTEGAALAKLQIAKESSNQALAKLRNLKATGRISLDLNEGKSEEYKSLPALKLENGDRLVIPSQPDFVHIFGAVNQEASMIWRKGISLEKYLSNAGLTADADVENIFILRANGTVLSQTNKGWFTSINSYELMPGDTIVVPEQLNKERPYKTLMTGLKDWAQILTGFGLGAAGLKSLK